MRDGRRTSLDAVVDKGNLQICQWFAFRSCFKGTPERVYPTSFREAGYETRTA